MPTATAFTVTVTFTYSGGPAWSFSSQNLTGNTSGVKYGVIWTLASGSASGASLTANNPPTLNNPNWTGSVPPALPSGWSMPTVPSGALSQGVDNARTQGSGNKGFPYKITVTYNPGTGSQNYTSADPELVLQPPG